MSCIRQTLKKKKNGLAWFWQTPNNRGTFFSFPIQKSVSVLQTSNKTEANYPLILESFFSHFILLKVSLRTNIFSQNIEIWDGEKIFIWKEFTVFKPKLNRILLGSSWTKPFSLITALFLKVSLALNQVLLWLMWCVGRNWRLSRRVSYYRENIPNAFEKEVVTVIKHPWHNLQAGLGVMYEGFAAGMWLEKE